MENKRGERHARSTRRSPRSATRKGECEGPGRRSWRLTGERAGHGWREKREGERDSRFHRGRMRSEESTGAAWNLRGRCGRDGKLPGKAPGSTDPTCQRRVLFTAGDRPSSARSDSLNNPGDVARFFLKKLLLLYNILVTSARPRAR
jgi:hypothetical protein